MTKEPSAPRRRSRRVRVLRAAGCAAASLLVLGAAFSAWIEHACVYEPPALPEGRPESAWRVVQASPTVRRCGPAWLVEDEGLAEAYLEGDAFARGREMSELCLPFLDEEEKDMRAQLDRALPHGVKRWLVRKGVLFAFRDLQSYLDPEDELAVAAGVPIGIEIPPRPMDDVAPLYHRLLFYQTLYDTGQSMAESGLLDSDVGCTSFAASGAATAGGGLVVGRTCDFEGGDVFDERKVVYFNAPSKGQRHVSVSWGGLIGALTGVNESGLVVMLHAARTERTKWPRVGRPVPMILGAALREDRTIEDVAKRFRESPRHAAAMVLVAETATGRSAVVETDPDRTVIVAQEDGVTICANHLRDAAWDADEVARRVRRSGSSSLRFGRMKELVAGARGRIDAPAAASFLRDRAGLGGKDVGLGNRTAVCAMIAAHMVVWDGAARRLYVSRAPRGLGEFVAYDVGGFFDSPAAPTPDTVRAREAPRVPAAPDVEAAAAVASARVLLQEAEDHLRDGSPADALRRADEAVRLMDRAPPALLVRARALLALGRGDEARADAAAALARQPIPGVEEESLRAIVAGK